MNDEDCRKEVNVVITLSPSRQQAQVGLRHQTLSYLTYFYGLSHFQMKVLIFLLLIMVACNLCQKTLKSKQGLSRHRKTCLPHKQFNATLTQKHAQFRRKQRIPIKESMQGIEEGLDNMSDDSEVVCIGCFLKYSERANIVFRISIYQMFQRFWLHRKRNKFMSLLRPLDTGITVGSLEDLSTICLIRVPMLRKSLTCLSFVL